MLCIEISHRLEKGLHSCQDGTRTESRVTTAVPPGAKPALETEAKGPNWRVQTRPVGGSIVQPQPGVRTCESSPSGQIFPSFKKSLDKIDS